MMKIPKPTPEDRERRSDAYLPHDPEEDRADDTLRPIDGVEETARRLAALREHEKKHPATTRSFRDILAEVSRERAAREGGDRG